MLITYFLPLAFFFYSQVAFICLFIRINIACSYFKFILLYKHYMLLLFSHSVISDSLWPHTAAYQASFVLNHLLEFAQTHVHWVYEAIQASHPLSSPSPSAFSLSQHQGLSQWVSSLHQVAKLLEFQLQHQSFQWVFRVISFRMDWLDLLSIQGTLKSLLPHDSSKASVLKCSDFFIVPALTSVHDYGKNHSFDYEDLCS